MFSGKNCNYTKLRTNLRLAINRLKLLEKKKTELALKARKEIADYIANGKEDRARIRVEHIVREDYLVEAMEIIEMFCDLLLARFGLVEKMKEMDPGLEEAIATMIWASPRLSADVQEMKEIQNQLTRKYGKEYAEMCLKNGFENVNEKVMHKMSIAAPPKSLIENYMVEIARTYKVAFEPDPTCLLDEPPEVSDLIEFQPDQQQPMGAIGQESYDNEQNEKKRPRTPPGPGFGGGGGGGGGGFPAFPHPSQSAPGVGPYPTGPSPPYEPPGAGSNISGGPPIHQPPPLPSQPPNAGIPPNNQSLPQYNDVVPPEGAVLPPTAPTPAPRSQGPPGRDIPSPQLPELPGLPSVPSSTLGGASAAGDDIDFDDLTRRFEDLKKKK